MHYIKAGQSRLTQNVSSGVTHAVRFHLYYVKSH